MTIVTNDILILITIKFYFFKVFHRAADTPTTRPDPKIINHPVFFPRQDQVRRVKACFTTLRFGKKFQAED